ncbi:hypothetical protein [Cupriavidus sp. MP-37]|uniref:hypothetical protein n=1 Tax=Cupriavidus sp. MP-37 TaxID=2884455 RepID=UPI001D0AC134|nr:hypothetical protein [Cupriavidus sp. MP-37]UDM49291.1 hypothetical protein LIN44_11730 [Cupriavidus sp. MP-37]
MTFARPLMKAVLAAACLALPLHATACGSDFVLGDEVGAAHPASIGVAFAIFDARNAGMLAPASQVSDANARLSADEAAHLLEQRLAVVRARLPAVSLLLVESRLWTRYAPGGRGNANEHADHDAGPVDGDVVVVTGEEVLRGLLEGRIAWQQAVDGGLVALSGEPEKQARVAKLLAGRFAKSGGAALAVFRSSPLHL